jgi:hypothetical protein
MGVSAEGKNKDLKGKICFKVAYMMLDMYRLTHRGGQNMIFRWKGPFTTIYLSEKQERSP